jgi:ferric-dicitrate binding protein FerR (iron transport regulator)
MSRYASAFHLGTVSQSRLAALSAALAALAGLSLPPAQCEADCPGYLSCRPLPPRHKLETLPVGKVIRTGVGQRRRLDLAGGSQLLVNEKTRLRRTAEQSLEVAAGEVLVEVAGGEELRVKAPGREVRCAGGQVALRITDDGTSVLVAGGRARVEGIAEPVRAGQQLQPRADKPAPAPRASHLLAWARDLVDVADSPLVPASRHAGGSLVVRDPDGQEANLVLRRYHVDVYVQNGFARTTIDQTFFNHAQSRLEGTFHFPLPPDASLSRLAMYTDGRLNDGGMVERDYGRMVYERIRYQQQDPALLEWVDGSTFRMRVFPLEPRQEKRILLSYTQKLPTHYGQATYRFPAGHSLDRVHQFSGHVRLKGGARAAWNSPSHAWTSNADGDDLILDVKEMDARLGRDLVLTMGDPSASGDQVRFASAEQDGAKYLMLRYRPDLPASAGAPQRRDWVFLFESSGERDPLLARTQVEIVRGLLAHAGPDDRFLVLTAGSRLHRHPTALAAVTTENVQEAIALLERTHLIGALDLAAALTAAGLALEGAANGHIVHVGSGVTAMGERRTDELVRRLPAGVRYVGVGVGHRWNRAFMKAAAERTGGYFTQINPDEPVSWRTFELASTLDSPRLLDVRAEDGAGRARFLPFTGAVAHGEELAAIARIDGGTVPPEAVIITGTLDGRPFRRELPVRDVAAGAGYLPRTWAQLEIERLLAEDAVKHKDAVIALSKAMYVMTPFTSLLVLENEEMYQQYKVDRGRKDHWAMYPAPERIEVVYEPEDGPPYDPRKGIKPSATQVMKTILVREPPRLLTLRAATPTSPAETGFALNAMPALPFRNQPEYPSLDSTAQAGGRLLWEASKEGRNLVTLNSFELADGAPDVREQKAELLEHATAGEGRLGRRGPRVHDAMRYQVQAQTRLEVDDEAARTGKVAARRPSGDDIAVPDQFLIAKNSNPFNPHWTEEVASRPPPLRRPHGIWNGASVESDVFEVEKDGSESRIMTRSRALRLLDRGRTSHPPLYERPSYSLDEQLFFDLVAYAPGMNTLAADVRAVLEAEAAGRTIGRPGEIDQAARDLFATASSVGWRSVTFPTEAGNPGWTVRFDGKGRWAWQRQLAVGLREQVVCDGVTLYHVYPDFGLAARRSVGRHYRLAFAGLVPWALPRPEDLARGADLRTAGERTVAVVPHGAGQHKGRDGKPRPHREIHFVFTAGGELAERRVVEVPSCKVLVREAISPEGVIRRFDADGKEYVVCKSVLSATKGPRLQPELTDIVVLPLPYRTAEHVIEALGIAKKAPNELTFDEGRDLLAAKFAGGNGDSAAENLFKACFHARDQRQLGYYVLLAACGCNLDGDHLDMLAEHYDRPLAQYLALHSSPVLRKHASQWAAASNAWGEGLLRHLAESHALYQRWQTGDVRPAELERALAYVRRNQGSPFGWALLGLVADRARDTEAQGKDVRAVHAALAPAWAPFARVSGLAYAARYEQARSLYKSGQAAEARNRFVALFDDVIRAGGLPAIDADFRAALVGDGKGPDAWGALLRRTAARLVKDRHRAAVLLLARQCWAIEDRPAARELYGAVMDGARPAKEDLSLALAGLEFLWGTGQLAEAEQLLGGLLADAELAREPVLWRLARKLAGQRDMPGRELECLERALDLEFLRPPEVIDLQQVRQEYGELLNRYQAQAETLVTLRLAVPADFRAKVVRAADRWRALDRDGDDACTVAARTFHRLGDRDGAWDYLTTPVGRRPAEAAPWLGLARDLVGQGEPALADRAFAAAFEAEPTDAQTLWERAENLQRVGQADEARRLYRRLAAGPWSPRFAGLQAQARWKLEGR